MNDYIKHLLVRTPLEEAAITAQRIMGYPHLLLRPEQALVRTEGPRIREGLKRLLRESSNCVDVGAHIGSVLSVFSRCAPRGSHVAFEPTPEKAAWLRKKFPEVEIHEVALAEHPGTSEFSIHRRRSGFSGLRRFDGGEDDFETLEVRLERLDDLLPPEHRVDVMKIVIEGAELSALRGATRVIGAHRPAIVFECSLDALSVWDLSPDGVYDFFEDAEYHLRTPQGFLAGAPPMSRDAFAAAQHYPQQAFKFFATPRGR